MAGRRTQQRRSKEWGSEVERATARLLSLLYPRAERSGAGKAAQGKASNDIAGTNLWVSVKARAKNVVSRWWEDAEAARRAAVPEPGLHPQRTILVFKRKRGALMVTMPLADWVSDQLEIRRLREDDGSDAPGVGRRGATD